MAQIVFVISDANRQGIEKVSVVANCLLKNKTTWKSGALTSSVNGIALLKIDNTVVLQFDWNTLQLDIRFNDKPLEHTIGEQSKTGRGKYRVNVTVSLPPVVEPPDPDIPIPSIPGDPVIRDNYNVSGLISADDGRPLFNLHVRLANKGIGKEKILGTDQSDALGKYHIAFRKNDVLDPNLDTMNYVVRVYDNKTSNKPLAISPLKQSVRLHEIINLEVSRLDYRGPALFDIVNYKIEALKLDTAYENLSENDALLVAKQSSQPIEQVQQFIQAHVIAGLSGKLPGQEISAEPVFGVLHAGLKSTVSAFAGARDSTLIKYIENAIAENWINEVQPKAVIDSLRPVRVMLLIEDDIDTSNMLKVAGVNDEQLNTIFDSYLQNNQSLFRVLQQLGEKGELPKGTVDSTQDSITLLEFTGGNRELVNILTRDYGIKRSIELARLTLKDWLDIATTYYTRSAGGIDDDSLNKLITALATNLDQEVEKEFPTAVFSFRWSIDTSMDNSPVQDYLEDHSDFDFAEQRLQQYWNEDSNLPAENAKPPLKRTERLFHITPEYQRFPAFKACWEMEINSASDVLNRGRGRFVQSIAAFGINATVANVIYRKAQRVFSHNILSQQPAPVDDVDDSTDDYSMPVRVEPTISALFGAQGGNGCPHCVSAFSPSAYLVDMLRFLQRAETTNKINGLELLFLRRPDINNLRLDCANSDTVMPYLDLVNEVLEHIVASSNLPFQVPLDWMVEPALNLQTEANAEELAAHPEHLDVEAYNRLRTITAPWGLPYNLWSDEVRTYLAQIGVDRADLLAVLRSDADPFKILEIAVERLAIDATEAIVISLPADTEVKRNLVWLTSDPATDLKDLRLFLKRTDLSYEQAADIFNARFVNPQHRAILPADINDLELAILNFKPEDNDRLLDHFHRFTRLWRKTGWSTLELDAVMQHLVVGDLDENSLTNIGIIAEIQHRYGTPIEELASWYGDINTYGTDAKPALYQRNFLDGTVHGVVGDGAVDLLKEVFAIKGKGNSRDLVVTQGANTHDKWLAQESPTLSDEWELHPDYTPIVMAACKLTAEELTAIVASKELLERKNKAVVLNLANLSQLFRTASIARSLGEKVQDCLVWQQVLGKPLGISKSTVQEPPATLSLLLGITEQLNAGVKADVMRYTLLDEDVVGLAPTVDEIILLLSNIRAELLKSAELFRIDTLVAREQLQLWFSLDSTLVVDEVKNDITFVINLIDGSEDYVPEIEPKYIAALNFLSLESKDQLFKPNSIVNKDERLSLVASETPVDTNLLKQTDTLLRAQSVLDDSTIMELLRIFSGVSELTTIEKTALLSLHFPYIDYTAMETLSVNDRLQVVNKVLFDYNVRKPAVFQMLAAATGVSERHIELLATIKIENNVALIELLLHSTFIENNFKAEAASTKAVQQLFRHCTLLQSVSLEATEVEFALTYSQQIGLFDFHISGVDQILNWNATVLLHNINSIVAGSEKTIYSLLESILTGGIDEAATQNELSSLFGVATNDVETLLGVKALNFTYPDNYLWVTGLHRLFLACGFVQQSGVAAEQVLQLAENIMNTEQASIARAAVRSKYDEDSWLGVSKQLRTDLRERQRDALLAFILSRGAFDLNHETAYAFYLIDIDMSACFQTTRMKQAIASVQQFVQRILLGLEFENLEFTKEDAAEWQWRKNYRVWEANVRVFMYPENWIVPELRDDKTPLFKTFEQELMQGELDNELAENTVTHYLEKLHGISNLEVVGLYEDTEHDYTLNIIARSYNSPHEYFYRTWNGEIWSPWELIEIDIEGEHITPVVYNNKLYVFWATFKEEVNQQAVDATGFEDNISDVEAEIEEIDGDEGFIATYNDINETLSEAIEIAPKGDPIIQINKALIDINISFISNYYSRLKLLSDELTKLETELAAAIETHSYQMVHMNWIVRGQSGWSAKQVTKTALKGTEGHTPSDYQFVGTSNRETLTLQVVVDNFVYDREPNVKPVGLFSMSDCSGEMTVTKGVSFSPPKLEIFDKNSKLDFNRYKIQMRKTKNYPKNLFSALGITLLYDSPDSNVYATTLHQVDNRATPFFLSIGKHTFFVEKKLSGAIPDVEIPDVISDASAKLNLKTQQLAKTSFGGMTQGGNEKYHFSSHYHPYTCACLRQIRRYGIAGLYSPDPDLQPGDDAQDLFRQLTLTTPRFNFEKRYDPNRSEVSGDPKDKIDFSFGSSYGQYNWEIFYHIPMMIATRLIQNRKFEQAQKWLHYIFDPTEKDGIGLEKYWKIKPFYYSQIWGATQENVEEQLDTLDDEDALSLDSLIEQWEQHPFQPYAIARFRIVVFMRRTVMTYLDNLIAWADSLFERDTMESINEATQLYILANSILGERPIIIDQQVPGRQTFTVREFLNGQVSQSLPARQIPATSNGKYSEGAQGILGVIEQFCLPYNDRMLDYWDTVADRLFKIRHCLNIDGVYRLLPVYEPPIDPALLVRAAAAGLDIGTVLSDLSAPRPHYRFTYIMQKASEMISMVQGIGSQLLSAMEKKDAEALSHLRSENEISMLKLTTTLRQDSIKEAEEQIRSMNLGKVIIELRRDFYAGRQYMNTGEELDMLLRGYSWYLRTLSQVAQAAVTPLESIPDVTAGAAGISSPVTVTKVPRPADAAKSGAAVMNVFADLTQTAAGLSATMGQYDRRREEWGHQVELANTELDQFEKQLAAAQIRLAVSEKELANHNKQIEYSEQANAYLKDKFTNTELYNWMISEISSLYFQAYQLAFDMAKRAERCFQHELGIKDTSYIQFGYWDSLKKGLLAGDKLQLDIKRMETGYLEKNVRELELSKTISLTTINPEALLRLSETSECFISLPEQLFDLDFPGHYFRRIKNISLTIPAITGPYTTVSCTMTLLSDRIRSKTTLGEDENNFEWNVGSIQSIATSNAQGDSGLFQLDFRDERYLPFEGAGVISSWKLNLPNPDLAQFDYSTISDVLIQVNYTARDGGQVYRNDVEDQLNASLNSLIDTDKGYPTLLSLKNQFPNAWSRLLQTAEIGEQAIDFTIEITDLPYFLRKRVDALKTLKLIAIPKDDKTLDIIDESVKLNNNEAENIVFMSDPGIKVPSATFSDNIQVGSQSLLLSPKVVQSLVDIKDLLIVCMFDVT